MPSDRTPLTLQVFDLATDPDAAAHEAAQREALSVFMDDWRARRYGPEPTAKRRRLNQHPTLRCLRCRHLRPVAARGYCAPCVRDQVDAGLLAIGSSPAARTTGRPYQPPAPRPSHPRAIDPRRDSLSANHPSGAVVADWFRHPIVDPPADDPRLSWPAAAGLVLLMAALAVVGYGLLVAGALYLPGGITR